MDGDPWADAPLSSSPSTPSAQKSPIKATAPSALSKAPRAESPSLSPSSSSPSFPQSPSVPPPRSPSTEKDVNSKLDPSELQRASDDALVEDESCEVTLNPLEHPAQSLANEELNENEGFDDFDDFGETAEAGPSGPSQSLEEVGGEDEGFGDFGDFEEGDFEESAEPDTIEERAVVQEPEAVRWHALSLRPLPPASELFARLTTLLEPILVPDGGILTSEPPRQVGGLSQIMSSESSREVYAQLTTPPMLKTLDWTRSRTRREHLISMGVPVNLDEVDSHRISVLPPLRIVTNPSASSSTAKRSSTDSYRSSGLDKGKGRAEAPGHGSQSVPVSAVTNGDNRKKYGLGSRPIFDVTKAEDLCGLEEDRLSLISLEKLKAMQEDLVQTSAQASALLAWNLQYKDAQTQDSATYNGMISGLIANAAKAKSAQAAGSGGVFKRSSMRRPQSGSPGMSPRIGSPAMR